MLGFIIKALSSPQYRGLPVASTHYYCSDHPTSSKLSCKARQPPRREATVLHISVALTNMSISLVTYKALTQTP